jgi:hypothetical protein
MAAAYGVAPFLTCVTTQRANHPPYGLGYQECDWNSQRFKSWFNPTAVGVAPRPTAPS